MLALERVRLLHIVATPSVLDELTERVVLRVANDEAFLFAGHLPELSGDPHAIIQTDDGFAAGWLPVAEALDLLARTCDWELPAQLPAFAQGAVAGVPAKLWFEPDRVLFVIPAAYISDFEARIL